MVVIKSWTEKHGGTIAFNSTAGMGTEFTIALPVKANGSA
ncbi:HAMP domain-containing histidine kinase [Microcoleus asticus]|nr:HAMP domain-containing histidine kinase [Microcoleus asticus]